MDIPCTSDRDCVSARQQKCGERLAKRIAGLGLGPVTKLLLETFRPLNSAGSQLCHFFTPFARVFRRVSDYDTLAALLEDRRSAEWLLEAIENEEAACG